MLYDENIAVEKIKNLDSDVRKHLMHIFRNNLQTILVLNEEGKKGQVRNHILHITHELAKVGL